MLRRLLPFTALALFFACASAITLYDLKTGETLTGDHRPLTQTIIITLPTGETLEGRYQKLTTLLIKEDSLFYRANLGALLGRNTGERLYGHARLTGDRGTLMEMVLAVEWTGHGFGVARTRAGNEYRVTF
ncbi:MAG: hypothetical protein AB1555_13230 [Nitrospirota bacterium]